MFLDFFILVGVGFLCWRAYVNEFSNKDKT